MYKAIAACMTVMVMAGSALALKPKEHVPLSGTGAIALTDASHLEYFINTGITFSTSSSASGAMSEASYTTSVLATTKNGGTVLEKLSDAFDGYNSICLSLNHTVVFCETGNANFVIYNKNGKATTECNGRQVVLNTQTFGSLVMQRKVFVPNNDSFARWLDIFTNIGASSELVTMVVANNLGSDSHTLIDATSNGDTVADLQDTWVTTFQNFSGSATTSSDPRLGHVLQGPGAHVPLAGINFANGDDNPFWGYTFTLAPGETRIIMNFVTGQPSRAAARAKAAELVGLPPNTLQCMTRTEQAEVLNFSPRIPAVAPALNWYGIAGLGLLLSAGGVLSLRMGRRRAA